MKSPGLILLWVRSAKRHKVILKSPGCTRRGGDGLEESFSSHPDRKWKMRGYFPCDRGHHVHFFLAGGVPSFLLVAKAWWGWTPPRSSPPVFGSVWGAAWPSPPVDVVLLLAWPPLWGKYIQHYLSSVSPARLGSSLTKKWAGRCPRASSDGHVSARQERWANLRRPKINSREGFAPRFGSSAAETETGCVTGQRGNLVFLCCF